MNNNFIGVEKTTKRFLDKIQKNPGLPIYKLSPNDARNVLSVLQSVPVEKPAADVQDLFIPGKSNEKINIQIIRRSIAAIKLFRL
jgi:acetyl esterase